MVGMKNAAEIVRLVYGHLQPEPILGATWKVVLLESHRYTALKTFYEVPMKSPTNRTKTSTMSHHMTASDWKFVGIWVVAIPAMYFIDRLGASIH